MGKEITTRFRVYGIVQGVGFRPTVDRHASASGIRGSVCNKGPYVEIFAQGSRDQIDRFETLLTREPPRRSSILKIDKMEMEGEEIFEDFSIVESEKTQGEIFVSPDIAICEDCMRELYDPSDRRYLHPFINCTCCGPRLTILDALPYDRERTSMKMFPMCRRCAGEYHDPLSRRYDAQPVCCNECGPEVYLLSTVDPSSVDPSSVDLSSVDPSSVDPSSVDPSSVDLSSGSPYSGNSSSGKPGQADAGPGGRSLTDAEQADGSGVLLLKTGKNRRGRDAITAARKAILAGEIVAVKGIGGFHLCCDATNEEAVTRLRQRKRRPAKPFAVMMRDEETVRRECVFNEEERQILTGHQKPILLLDRNEEAPERNRVAPAVAPGNPRIGVMLPYAPLHLLLFTYDDGLEMPDCLIMTSGNVSGAPICRDDKDAMTELSGFCDCILSHDRLIRIRADDTVMDFHRGHPYMIRRSRGYAPLPVFYSGETKGCVLAVGGELKNTFCIASGNLFYLSPYVGDLEDLRTVRALEETIGRMEKLLEASPRAVVCDLHPKYNSTAVAEEIAARRGIPLFRIQHHYAHVLSCMAENDRRDPVIGVSFDGTGYGEDGTIWGGEILIADASSYERVGSIAPFLQIGGDSAPRQGWRIAASMIRELCETKAEDLVPSDRQELLRPGKPDAAHAYFDILERLSICDLPNARAQRMMAERGIQTIVSTSAGRLFDAVSAMLGICRESTYEGQASTELEYAAERYAGRTFGQAIPPDGLSRAPVEEVPERTIQYPGKDREGRPDGEKIGHLPTDRLFAGLLKDRLAGQDPEKLAWDFHAGLAGLIVKACQDISGQTGINTVALSGGCFQNRLLLTLVEDGLTKAGVEVLIHHLVPPNDGGIALGQALAAMAAQGEH